MKNEEVLDHIEEMIEQIKELAEYKKKTKEEKSVEATKDLVKRIQTCLRIVNQGVSAGLDFSKRCSYTDILNYKPIVDLLSYEVNENTENERDKFVSILMTMYFVLIRDNLNKTDTIHKLEKELEKYNKSFWERIWS